MNGEILFQLGVALMGIAVAGAVIAGIALRVSGKRLRALLEQDYGKLNHGKMKKIAE